MTIRNTVLHVEELGQRVLASVSPVGLPVTAPAVTAIGKLHNIFVGGQGHGTYTIGAVHPDAGMAYHLQGTGDFAGLGKVAITGDLHSVGFIFHGHAFGTMTFRNAHGSVTIELTGPTQHGFAPLPHQFYYQVISGTGAYTHAHGQGVLHLQLTAAAPGAHGAGHGTFTLSI
jgi:hypothetical protein